MARLASRLDEPLKGARILPFRGIVSPPTMAHGMTEIGVYVVVHGKDSPRAEEWTEYVGAMHKVASRIRGVLVFTLGEGPNAAQRQEVARMWASHGSNPSIAVLTPNAMARTLIMALNWFLSRPIHAFAPTELPKALDHLGVDARELPALRKVLDSYAGQVGISIAAPQAA
jgi:hypothetical protein